HHAEHASHDPFARWVAITMVVIAAVLAGVKVLGHRSHNETLQLQIEAGNHRTEASDVRTRAGDIHTQADTLDTRAGVARTRAVAANTEASNQWAFYQAKKLRQHFYEGQSELVEVLARDDSKTSSTVAGWKANAERYKKETQEIAEAAKKAKEE